MDGERKPELCEVSNMKSWSKESSKSVCVEETDFVWECVCKNAHVHPDTYGNDTIKFILIEGVMIYEYVWGTSPHTLSWFMFYSLATIIWKPNSCPSLKPITNIAFSIKPFSFLLKTLPALSQCLFGRTVIYPHVLFSCWIDNSLGTDYILYCPFHLSCSVAQTLYEIYQRIQERKAVDRKASCKDNFLISLGLQVPVLRNHFRDSFSRDSLGMAPSWWRSANISSVTMVSPLEV